jgi:hypothetical protein
MMARSGLRTGPNVTDSFRLLRLGGKAKRKGHSPESKPENDFIRGQKLPPNIPNTPRLHYSTTPFFHLITLSALASTFGGIIL